MVGNSSADPTSGEVLGMVFGDRDLFCWLVLEKCFFHETFTIAVFKCELMRAAQEVSLKAGFIFV